MFAHINRHNQICQPRHLSWSKPYCGNSSVPKGGTKATNSQVRALCLPESALWQRLGTRLNSSARLRRCAFGASSTKTAAALQMIAPSSDGRRRGGVPRSVRCGSPLSDKPQRSLVNHPDSADALSLECSVHQHLPHAPRGHLEFLGRLFHSPQGHEQKITGSGMVLHTQWVQDCKLIARAPCERVRGRVAGALAGYVAGAAQQPAGDPPG